MACVSPASNAGMSDMRNCGETEEMGACEFAKVNECNRDFAQVIGSLEAQGHRISNGDAIEATEGAS